METVSLNSDVISQVSYAASGLMQITFTQGRTYDFCGVPRYVFEGLISANSAGKYYNDYDIRDAQDHRSIPGTEI